MPRPMKKRNICAMPKNCEFIPGNGEGAASVELGVDEFECVRLIDYLRLTQDDCAAQMNVARTTVQAVYNSAREKIADALVNGKRLVITGGSYVVCGKSNTCCGKDCIKRNCEGRQCVENCQCRKKTL